MGIPMGIPGGQGWQSSGRAGPRLRGEQRVGSGAGEAQEEEAQPWQRSSAGGVGAGEGILLESAGWDKESPAGTARELRKSSAGTWGQGGDTPGACTPNPPKPGWLQGEDFPCRQELCRVPGVTGEEGWELQGHGMWVSHHQQRGQRLLPRPGLGCSPKNALGRKGRTGWEPDDADPSAGTGEPQSCGAASPRQGGNVSAPESELKRLERTFETIESTPGRC